jgi:hypothetical protein
MNVTLNGLHLPDDLIWRDEFDWAPVEQVVTPTLSGALLVEETGHAQSVRLAGWEVAQLLIHPDGMTVRVLGEGSTPATSSTWLDAALTLWGFAPSTDWDREVDALVAPFERRP